MPRVERFWEAFSTPFRILPPSAFPERQWPAYLLRLTLGAIYSAEGRLVPAAVRVGGVEGDQVMAADPDTALLDPSDVVRIAGRTAFLGNHMAHYGHFVTEFLSALWDFRRLDEYDQYAVFPFIFDGGSVRFAPYHTQALECLGVDPRRVLVLGKQPASFALIDVFERLWHNNDRVDPAVVGVYDRLLAEFGARRNDCERRIFLSRQSGVGLQRMANTGDVEAVFARHGFEILYPEKMDFAEQISRYANARVVAGFAGSAMHNCVFMRSGVLVEVGDLRSQHGFHKMQVLANSLRPITPCRIEYVGDERGVIDVAHVDRRLAGILAETRRHVGEYVRHAGGVMTPSDCDQPAAALGRAAIGAVTRRTFEAFDVAVAIETHDPRLYALLDDRLPSFSVGSSLARVDLRYRVIRARGSLIVTRARRTLSIVQDLEEAADCLVADLQSMLGRLASGWTFLHAGVVALGNRALVLPGRSCAGKTTLVTALLRAGASYGSDEFAVIDAGGSVHPYPRPLAHRAGERFVSAAQLGAPVMQGAWTVGAVVFAEFQPAAAGPLQRLSPGLAVLRLLEHCNGVRQRSRETLRSLHALASTAPTFAAIRGEADAFAPQAIACMRSEGVPA